jgi:hypothetical protein
MSIETWSDEALLSQIKLNAAQERKSGLAVIHQLREVARRRLDAKLGYESLHKYCMEELHYSPGSAWRRINAMRALSDIPELETRIASGSVSVATVSQVESFCRRENISKEEKREILTQIEGLSKRETERVLADIAPLPVRPEKIRLLDASATEIRVTLNAETLAALDHIRNLISHARPNATYAEAIEYLAKFGIKKLDPLVLPPSGNIERKAWQRDGGKCTYVSPGGKKCESQTFLQFDHIIPKSKGGPDTLDNLRLRCRAHNLLAGVEEFREAKMSQFLERDATTSRKAS